MATFYIDDYIDFGTKGYHNATSWQVAIDPQFEKIIDQSLDDKINVKQWNSPLPRIDAAGFYKDLDNIYVRVKVHIFNSVSPWFVLPEVLDQNKQLVTYTENGIVVKTANSLAIGLN